MRTGFRLNKKNAVVFILTLLSISFVIVFRSNRTRYLDYIPKVPDKESLSVRVPILSTYLSKPYLYVSPRNYSEHVVILSPIRDSSTWLRTFTTLLKAISYPHDLISVHFGEEGSVDDTFKVAEDLTKEMVNLHGYRNASVVKLDVKGNNTTRQNRHSASTEQDRERRIHLARVRNMLMKYALDKSVSWILWIDSDVIEFRQDVIQQFIVVNKDVMSASCLIKPRTTFLRPFNTYFLYYDQNSFRETWDANGNQLRIWLHDLKGEGRMAKLDCVGGCMLMLSADCVRKGLRFTEDPTEHVNGKYTYLETEGLGKMASKMGFNVYGLPFLEVFHVNEHNL